MHVQRSWDPKPAQTSGAGLVRAPTPVWGLAIATLILAILATAGAVAVSEFGWLPSVADEADQAMGP